VEIRGIEVSQGINNIERLLHVQGPVSWVILLSLPPSCGIGQSLGRAIVAAGQYGSMSPWMGITRELVTAAAACDPTLAGCTA